MAVGNVYEGAALADLAEVLLGVRRRIRMGRQLVEDQLRAGHITALTAELVQEALRDVGSDTQRPYLEECETPGCGRMAVLDVGDIARCRTCAAAGVVGALPPHRDVTLRDMPWCGFCQSYHHKTAPGCRATGACEGRR